MICDNTEEMASSASSGRAFDNATIREAAFRLGATFVPVTAQHGLDGSGFAILHPGPEELCVCCKEDEGAEKKPAEKQKEKE